MPTGGRTRRTRRWALAAAVAATGALGLSACVTSRNTASTQSGATVAPPGGTTPPAVSGSSGTGGRTGTGTTTTAAPPIIPSTSSVPTPPDGLAVSPADVRTIVANDTAINNKANGTLSIPLQDSHEACLQALMDDYDFRGLAAAGEKTSGPPFQQVPGQAFVPRQSSYPAYFSVLAAFASKGTPKTDNLLTYVKQSPTAAWKLALTSQILGPTTFGVAVPGPASAGAGFTTALAPNAAGRMTTSGEIASAFTVDGASGRLPGGVAAQWGPGAADAPSRIRQVYLAAGATTVAYSAATPRAVVGSIGDSGACPTPAYRLADGGALAVFPIYLTLHVVAEAGQDLVQGSNRSQFGFGLEPGTYQAVTTLWGDVVTVIEPPAGSHAPLEVIGQGLEQLAATGVSTGSILT